MNPNRVRRVSEEIKKIVSSAIIYEIKDPRIPPMTTITRVDLTRDLSFAKIYVSFLAKSDEEKREVLEILNNAKGYVRGIIGRELNIYKTPDPKFLYDENLEDAMKMRELIKSLDIKKEEDNEEDNSDN